MKTIIEWIPVTLSFPPENTVCVVVARKKVVSNTVKWDGYRWVHPEKPDEANVRQDITHWHSLVDLEVGE
jgi:hypothetical protein